MNYFQATLRKKLSKDFDIKNIAKLASINLSEDEQKELDKDLSIILEHVKALSDLKLDTEQKEIFIHPLEKELELQEDKLVESLTHEEAIKEVSEERLDMVTWARYILANPDFVSKLENNKEILDMTNEMREKLY